jgi:signal transduction histidine kinase
MDARNLDRSTTRDAAEPAAFRVPWHSSLSTKLLSATVAFVLVAQLFVFLPWISEYRLNWMRTRVAIAQLVTVAFTGSEDLPRAVQDDVLARTGADVIALRTGTVRRLIAQREPARDIADTVDLNVTDGPGAIADSLSVMFSSDRVALRLIGEPGPDGSFIDMVVEEQMMRDAMWRFARRVALASLIVAVITGALIFFSLRWMFLRPLNRLVGAMAAFRAEPENPERVLKPAGRHDEIGNAERHLAAMQAELNDMLKERARLADLGTAVSKINHDLRNILGSAQLFTDRLATIPDKTAQRFGPKLISTLDRALGYSQAVLDYGKVREAPPQRRLVSLARLASDVADIMGLTSHPAIAFVVDVPETLEVDADPDQLFRVLMNLLRNAQLALETDPDPSVVRRITVSGRRVGGEVTIQVSDTGPGVPARAREKLFRPFEGGIRPGGTGLGLAICAELVRAHGGTIALLDSGPGATFVIALPDRSGVAGANNGGGNGGGNGGAHGSGRAA